MPLRFSATVVAAFLAIAAAPCHAADDYSTVSTEQLIGQLAALNSQMPGVDSTATYNIFAGTDLTARFSNGIIPNSPPSVPPQMRELVRRGVSALPNLINHLNDSTPTKIKVSGAGFETVGGDYFNHEYDARDRSKSDHGCDFAQCRKIEGPYVVKVGDICEVLIGQIVNRELLAVRYQPTAILYVNSPVETPSLARRIAQDWKGLTEGEFAKFLLHDLRTENDPYRYRDALVRLRFYYPGTYASLTGNDRAKRDALEKEEKAGRQQ
jgi:hypothetical protein